MSVKKYLGLELFLLVSLGLLNYYAFKYFLYWKIWWLDMPAHFLGGCALGLLGLIIWILWSGQIKPTTKSRLIASFLPVVLGGLLWESFELSADKIYLATISLKPLAHLQLGWADTLSDLFFDLIGAGSVVLLSIIFSWKKKEQK